MPRSRPFIGTREKQPSGAGTRVRRPSRPYIINQGRRMVPIEAWIRWRHALGTDSRSSSVPWSLTLGDGGAGRKETWDPDRYSRPETVHNAAYNIILQAVS
ncbi:hypothetical protein ElyMa_000744700 [Elysia marginata]|uniref:Uncharacterized protein n=1 Tax=Elysia marginata TaxID=1093978 RepID=A0AAV4GS63_9GAST|nr:hypothetical protein ElyMa_000744700 [Elysia marginata]